MICACHYASNVIIMFWANNHFDCTIAHRFNVGINRLLEIGCWMRRRWATHRLFCAQNSGALKRYENQTHSHNWFIIMILLNANKSRSPSFYLLDRQSLFEIIIWFFIMIAGLASRLVLVNLLYHCASTRCSIFCGCSITFLFPSLLLEVGTIAAFRCV